MPTPNLFDYATKELSQDAVICWLIKWADAEATEGPADGGLRQCGRAFVDALFGTWADWPVELGSQVHTEVLRQQNRIDVLARVNGRHVLLIEDKPIAVRTAASLAAIKTRLSKEKTPFGEVSWDDLFPIYVKTGNHSLKDRALAVDNSCRVFGRNDFLRVLETYHGINPILLSFRSHLERWEHETNSFLEWGFDSEKTDRAWEGLYRRIETDCLQSPDGSWGPLVTKVGQFWGLWISPAQESDTNSFEMWIEKDRISYRMYGAKGRQLNEAGMNREKQHWAGAFSRAGSDRFTKPNRLAATKTKPMCVAEWKGWIAFNANGQLDLNATKRNLCWALENLGRAVRQG